MLLRGTAIHDFLVDLQRRACSMLDQRETADDSYAQVAAKTQQGWVLLSCACVASLSAPVICFFCAC